MTHNCFDVFAIADEFKNRFGWSREGKNSLLHIGCGNGRITIDFILPLLPGNSGKVIGTDISQEMITSANKKYSREHPNIKFKVMDIADDNLTMPEKFNVVTSFFVFHLVKNLRQALKNIYSLLKPGGTALIVHVINCPLISACTNTYRDPKWISIINPNGLLNANYDIHFRTESDFKTLLKEEGFRNISCKAKTDNKVFNTVFDFLTFARTTNPYHKFIPKDSCDEYYKETLDAIKELIEDVSGLKEKREPKVHLPVTRLVIFAKKLK